MFSIQNVFFSSDLSNYTGQPHSFSSNRKKKHKQRNKTKKHLLDWRLPPLKHQKGKAAERELSDKGECSSRKARVSDVTSQSQSGVYSLVTSITTCCSRQTLVPLLAAEDLVFNPLRDQRPVRATCGETVRKPSRSCHRIKSHDRSRKKGTGATGITGQSPKIWRPGIGKHKNKKAKTKTCRVPRCAANKAFH